MSCRDCARWQCPNRLRSVVKWADCNHAIGRIYPVLFRVPHLFKEDIYWSTPFDPHDVKYYPFTLRKHLKRCELPQGMRKQIIREEDLIFDEEGNERVGKVEIVYFQTNASFNCKGAYGSY